MWNGAAETLNAMPAARNTSPNTSPSGSGPSPIAWAMPAKAVVPE